MDKNLTAVIYEDKEIGPCPADRFPKAQRLGWFEFSVLLSGFPDQFGCSGKYCHTTIYLRDKRVA